MNSPASIPSVSVTMRAITGSTRSNEIGMLENMKSPNPRIRRADLFNRR